MKTILIADDNPESLYMLEYLLKSGGYEVEKATNGAQALLMGLKKPPDMIITDILMPKMDGYILCREWMKNKTLKGIPFIFYSATYTDPRDQEFGLKLGAAKYIVKPKEPEDFFKIIKDIINAHESGQIRKKKKKVKSETIYLKEYNETLVRKLENKMLELGKTNQSLIQEIEERKKAEEFLRISLEEKKVLLKEIHHRIKNNLQVIISLLELQSHKLKNTQAIAALQETKTRVYSMALVHEKLYQSRDIPKIDFKDFLITVTKELSRIYDKEQRITLATDIQEIHLGIDIAVPCGLIVNELLSNALKHAFPQGQEGKITFSMQPKSQETYELIVQDNGVGIPDHINIPDDESIGLQLVTGLVEQINGSIEIKKEEKTTGTKVIITFQKPPS